MQSLPAPSSLRDAFLAVPELEKVTAGFGMLVPFLSQEQNSFRDVSEFQELCCRKGEQCFWIGKMESLSCFSHPAFAKGFPRGPRAGFQQPQHSESRAENGVLWAKTSEKPQDCRFLPWLHPGISKKSCDAGNRGFKAPFHVQAPR